MKTLTIRGIDPELSKAIKICSRKADQSINTMVLDLLRSACGIKKQPEFPTYHDLDPLAGGWTEADERQFLTNTREFEKIDKEIWS